MKAPDKIYCGNNGHGNLSYSTEKIYLSMEEYIRKDIVDETVKVAEDHAYFAGKEKLRENILEWAKLMRNDYDNSENAEGWNDCLDMLINHIESL